MDSPIVDVIIPVYRPDYKLELLLEKLALQNIVPHQIILLNTELAPDFTTAKIKKRVEILCSKIQKKARKPFDIRIQSIVKEEYDHGGTRAYGSSLSQADYLLYMTQDAIPKDDYLIDHLIAPFQDPKVAVAYARQEANKNAGVLEQYTRLYNYPAKDCVKSLEDREEYGIKTYFCSNVCAMYHRETYEELGGFVDRTIFNEDMIFAAKVIDAGYSIAYAASAKVIHSHSYTLMEQLRRNFDLGVSQREYQEIFQKISSEKEGLRFVKQTLSYLHDQKKYFEIFEFVMESAFKYLGFWLGKRYTYLPQSLRSWLSMNKAYWNK